MSVDGFELLLQDFCSYCPNFEPDVEQIDCTSFGDAPKYINNIRCINRQKCARIVGNLENKINAGK